MPKNSQRQRNYATGLLTWACTFTCRRPASIRLGRTQREAYTCLFKLTPAALRPVTPCRCRVRRLRDAEPLLKKMATLADAIAAEDFEQAAALRSDVVNAFETASLSPAPHNRIAAVRTPPVSTASISSPACNLHTASGASCSRRGDEAGLRSSPLGQVVWPRGGHQRAAGAGSAVVSVNPDGGQRLVLFKAESPSLAVGNLAWAPCGLFLAFALSPDGDADAAAVVEASRLVVVSALDGQVCGPPALPRRGSGEA